MKTSKLLKKQELQRSVLLANKETAEKISLELTGHGLPRKNREDGFTIYAPMLNANDEKKLCPVFKYTKNITGCRFEWDERFITINY